MFGMSASVLVLESLESLELGFMNELQLSELIRGQIEATSRLIDRQERFLDQVIKVTDDHEKRLRFLERVIGYGFGFAGALAILWRLFVGH